MKYMMIVKLDGNSEDARQYEAGTPPPEDFQQAIGKLIEKMLQSGVLVGTGGLRPLADGARIQVSGGKLSVTDGPYIESKEIIGGYAILDVGSKKEALQWSEEFMQIHIDLLGSSWVGELEIRQMSDPEGGCKFAEQ
ncbi:MAG: YciI family protein [Chthoniobacter sp.]|uniref:YciI family protein n=1 Tax=Chthoniobacter sp. TaxID=2510640 RepID=UPI0032AA59FC